MRRLPWTLTLVLLFPAFLFFARAEPETVLALPKAAAFPVVSPDGTINPLLNGIVADGKTDDTAAWVTFAAALPDGAVVRIPPGTAGSVVNGPIDFSGSGITIECPSLPDARPRGQRGGFEFRWGGAPNGNHVVGLLGCHGCRVSGLAVSCDAPVPLPPNWSPPACGIRVNNSTATPPRYVSTRNVLERIVVTPPIPTTKPGTFQAVVVGPAITSNDFMILRGVIVYPTGGAAGYDWGTGFTFNAGPNGYVEEMDHCTVSGAVVGIQQVDGSLWCHDCNGTGNGIDIQVTQCSAMSEYDRDRYEQTRGTMIVCGGSNAPLHFTGCSWGNYQGAGPCIVTTAKLLRLKGNVFRSSTTAQNSWPLLIAPQSATAAYGLELDGNWQEYVNPAIPPGFLPGVRTAFDNNRGF